MMEGRWDEAWRGDRIEEIVRREVPSMWGMGLEVDQAKEEMRKKSEGFSNFAATFAGEQPKVSSS